MIINLLASLEKQCKPFWIVFGFALIGGLGTLDLLTGYEFEFSLFYLIPIALLTWLTNWRLGIAASLVSGFVWLASDVASGHSYSQPVIYAWNTFIVISFFSIVALLLSTLKRALDHERDLAQTDFLTGAVNSRFFMDLVQMEIYRCQRYNHPFTIAYFDLDNFKTVNDQFGHATGDQVLQTVVNQTKMYLRKTAVLARLGGDEFALLLPETSQESARVVFSKIQDDLLVGMKQGNWPVTFSIGVLTCIDVPPTSNELVKLVDELMYSAKQRGKNAIEFSTYGS